MSLPKLSGYFPSFQTILALVLACILSFASSFAFFLWILPSGRSPKPLPTHDPRFVTFGRLYLGHLGNAYAGAWDDGATLLESGQPFSTALEAVTKSWATNRTQLFEHLATPEFAKLIPESTKDADVSPQARRALAAAWRGFALGLRR